MSSVGGRDNVVGIAIRYGLDGLGIESRWGGEIFRTRSKRSWGPPSLLYNGYRVSFPGVKRPGRGVDHPPPSRAEVKERVELYLYSSLWAFVACPRVSFTFTFYNLCKDAVLLCDFPITSTISTQNQMYPTTCTSYL